MDKKTRMEAEKKRISRADMNKQDRKDIKRRAVGSFDYRDDYQADIRNKEMEKTRKYAPLKAEDDSRTLDYDIKSKQERQDEADRKVKKAKKHDDRKYKGK